MKLIKLTHGKFAKVDDDAYELVSKYKWYVVKGKYTFYAYSKVTISKGKRITLHLHRVVLGITNPKIFIDHADGDGLNCMGYNLRVANYSQNGANSKKRCFGIKKMKIKKKNGKGFYIYFRACCMKNRVEYSKTYKTENEAKIGYNTLALKLHGEYARLNEI